jgi:hypothetical protein
LFCPFKTKPYHFRHTLFDTTLERAPYLSDFYNDLRTSCNMPPHQLLRTSQLAARTIRPIPRTHQLTQLRFKHGSVTTIKSNRAPAEWGAQWKRIGGCAAM